jgi:hypothetical protein
MAAQLLHTAATLKEAAQALQQAGVALAYGGLIFNLLPALRERIPGHFLGEQLEAVPQRIHSLMAAPNSVPTAPQIPEEYLRALHHFQERRGLIEAHVMRALDSEASTQNHLAMANRELSLNIGAALALGDMDFLGTDIEWVAGLLRNHGLPAEVLYSYLHAYRRTVGEQLDERGEPIITWLGKVLNGHPSN